MKYLGNFRGNLVCGSASTVLQHYLGNEIPYDVGVSIISDESAIKAHTHYSGTFIREASYDSNEYLINERFQLRFIMMEINGKFGLNINLVDTHPEYSPEGVRWFRFREDERDDVNITKTVYMNLPFDVSYYMDGVAPGGYVPVIIATIENQDMAYIYIKNNGDGTCTMSTFEPDGMAYSSKTLVPPIAYDQFITNWVGAQNAQTTTYVKV